MALQATLWQGKSLEHVNRTFSVRIILFNLLSKPAKLRVLSWVVPDTLQRNHYRWRGAGQEVRKCNIRKWIDLLLLLQQATQSASPILGLYLVCE